MLFFLLYRGILKYFILANLHGVAYVCQLCTSEGSHVAIPRGKSQKYAIILQCAAEYITTDAVPLLQMLYICLLRLS